MPSTTISPALSKSLKQHIHDFAFAQLFNEMGWDNYSAHFSLTVAGRSFTIQGAAQKRGYQVYVCSPDDGGQIPDHAICRRIDSEVLKRAYLHMVIFIDGPKQNQKWFWVRRKKNQPAVTRSWPYHVSQSGELLARKLDALRFTLEDEEQLTQLGVIDRMDDTLDVERVTKRFYDFFAKERKQFADLLKGIEDADIHSEYVSVMISRLMFLHFIQAKGLLASNSSYLQEQFAQSKRRGKNRFYSEFLCTLFFDGLATPEADRTAKTNTLLGRVPYLNGGLFARREVEKEPNGIAISDDAFESLLAFFGRYQWHLDDRPLRNQDEINPDILGYIFEKYINQKQMGAYYTKEDITGYISQNTILPYLLSAAAEECPEAFAPSSSSSSVWSLLQVNPDDYLYDAVRHGVVDANGKIVALPAEIAAGIGDVSKRTNWNRPATEPYALPTETWREHIARRQRCLELRDKLAKGEIHEIDDLITYNLNIRVFVQDIVETLADPDLLRAFHAALSKVTILDPTCGSGAFLFAALNILEPLYEACLNRMTGYVSGTIELPLPELLQKMSPEMRDVRQKNTGCDANDVRLREFAQTLRMIDKHQHNRRYFIYKSIIVNNLFGVDIMEEAVEICKLRLFLKLVCEADPDPDKPNYNVEPLPDIDFNVKAGNTLVGFATWQQVHQALDYGTLDYEKKSDAIRTKAVAVQTQINNFNKAQLGEQFSASHALAAQLKEGLRTALGELRHDLDHALSLQYGQIGEAKFAKWRKSHHPLHWCIEFPGITQMGGFDVAIGNPPYVEYDRKVQAQYTVNGYTTLDCGNLHAFVAERSIGLLKPVGRLGLIVPLPSINTSRMTRLQQLVKPGAGSPRSLWVSAFDERPSNLFSGVDQRLIIEVFGPSCSSPCLATTGIKRWQAKCRDDLFATLFYALQPTEVTALTTSILKLQDAGLETRLLRLFYSNAAIDVFRSPTATGQLLGYRTAGGRYWKIALDRPFESDSLSNKVAYLRGLTGQQAAAILMSSTFWWYYSSHFDMYNLKDYMIFGFRLSHPSGETLAVLSELGRKLQKSLEQNAGEQTIRSKTRGLVTSKQYVAGRSKAVIDEIDRVLARHYGFTDEELDFIINYDIKYRMGADDSDDSD